MVHQATTGLDLTLMYPKVKNLIVWALKCCPRTTVKLLWLITAFWQLGKYLMNTKGKQWRKHTTLLLGIGIPCHLMAASFFVDKKIDISIKYEVTFINNIFINSSELNLWFCKLYLCDFNHPVTYTPGSDKNVLKPHFAGLVFQTFSGLSVLLINMPGSRFWSLGMWDIGWTKSA